MDFTPTRTDVLLLFVFLVLFAWSGAASASLLLKKLTTGPTPVSPSILEWILCGTLSALTVTSVILLFTAQSGIFRIRFWLLLLAAFDVAASLLWIAARRRRAATAPVVAGGLKDLWLLPLLAWAFWMMNRPSEFVATYRDPGEYVNIAVKLSDSPSLRFRDPQFQRFDASERQSLFLHQPLEQAAFPEVLPGFYLADPKKGELLPQFFHLYPLWLALCFKLWRFEGVFLFNVLLSTFSICIVVVLAEQLFNSRVVGLAAGVLVASNAGQVWMSRSPFSEILAQVLLLGGLTLLALATRQKHRGLMALAGCVFGLSLFVRIDSVLILVGLSVLLLFQGQHRRWLFLPLIGFVAWSGLHVWLFSYPYFFHAMRTAQNASPGGALAGLLVCGGILLGLAWYRRLRMRAADAGAVPPRQGITAARKQFATAAMVLFGCIVFHGVFVRPKVESARQIVPMPAPHSGVVQLRNEINWVRLSWYLTPLGFGLAFLGMLRLIPRLVTTDSVELWPFAAILGAFGCFYLYKSQAFPDNYWVVRRYIEIVIPGSLILACFALQGLSRRSFRALPRRSGVVLAALAYLVVWLAEIRVLSGFFKERELSGTLGQMEVLAGLNRDADVLLLEQGVSQEFFSAPLKFIFQKTVYPLAHLRLDGVALRTLVEHWNREGKRVHLLSSDEHTEVRGGQLRFLPKERFEFKTRVVEPVYERLPRTMMDLKYGVQIYEVQPGEEVQPQTAVTLNMDFNFGFPTRGFHDVETTVDGEAFRWTSGSASLELPKLTAANAGVLSLSLAQDFPPEMATTARIHFNGHLLAERPLPRTFQVIRWPLPGAWLNFNGKNTISFDTATYAPFDAGLSDDRRQLGLMVDGVKLETLAPISAAHPLTINVGSEQDTLDADLSGFFSRDRDSYRWMAAEAKVKPVTPLNSTKPSRLVLRAVKSCPDVSCRQWLSVSVDGHAAGRLELVGTGKEFREYEFTLKPVTNPQAAIQLSVEPAWNPAKAMNSADSRTLGCAIDWIRID